MLRVGVNPHVIPFSYKNAAGELVGFDISYAYRLAHDLGVAIEFVPFDAPTLARDLSDHRFDIAMSGIYENDERLQSLTMSPAYYESPVALVVPSRDAAKFLDGNAAVSRAGLKLAVYDDPVLVPLSRSLFPKAQLVVIPNYDRLAGHGPSKWSGVDAGAGDSLGGRARRFYRRRAGQSLRPHPGCLCHGAGCR